MKRLLQWVIAAILICGSSVFTSCTNSEDNPVTTDLDLKPLPPTLTSSKRSLVSGCLRNSTGNRY